MNNQQVDVIKQAIAGAVASLFSLLLDDDESSKVNCDPNLILIRPLDDNPKIPKIEVIVFMKSTPSGDDIPVYQLILDGNILGNFRVSRIHSYTGNWRITDEAVIQMRRGNGKVDSVLSDIEHYVKGAVEARKPPLYKQYGRPCASTPPQITLHNSVSNVARQATKTAEENFASFNGGSFGHRQRHFHNMGSAVDIQQRRTTHRSPFAANVDVTVNDVISAARNRNKQGGSIKPNIINRVYRTFYYANSVAKSEPALVTRGLFTAEDSSKPVVLLGKALRHKQSSNNSGNGLTVSFINKLFDTRDSVLVTGTHVTSQLLDQFNQCPPELAADIENLTGMSLSMVNDDPSLLVSYATTPYTLGIYTTDAEMVCIEKRNENEGSTSIIYLQLLGDGGLVIHTWLHDIISDNRFPISGQLELTAIEDIEWLDKVKLILDDLFESQR